MSLLASGRFFETYKATFYAALGIILERGLAPPMPCCKLAVVSSKLAVNLEILGVKVIYLSLTFSTQKII